MTRINVVPVDELTRQHLVAEYREIVRIFALVRNSQVKHKTLNNFRKHNTINDEYVLGTGHVKFFYDKLNFILKRYHALIDEMRSRQYSPSPISDQELMLDINIEWFGDYIPTTNAITINRERINKRLAGDKS